MRWKERRLQGFRCTTCGFDADSPRHLPKVSLMVSLRRKLLLAKTSFDARIATLNPPKTHLAGKLLVILYLT
jgi:hypothetical protein